MDSRITNYEILINYFLASFRTNIEILKSGDYSNFTSKRGYPITDVLFYIDEIIGMTKKQLEAAINKCHSGGQIISFTYSHDTGEIIVEYYEDSANVQSEIEEELNDDARKIDEQLNFYLVYLQDIKATLSRVLTEEQAELGLKVNYDFINKVQNEIEGWL